MGKIPDYFLTKKGPNAASYYHHLLARNITPGITIFFKNIGLTNPNLVTFFSFLLLLISSLMVINLRLLNNVYYRISIACIIQLSIILDFVDGQLARITGRSSRFGAWYDRVSDRFGEFIIFVSCGYVAWQVYGNILLLFLGIITGYGLSIFTITITLSESILLDNIETLIMINKNKKNKRKNINNISKNQKRRKKMITSVLSKIFFFLNFGIGERYLYLSFFILINRIDIMLYIVPFLIMLKCSSKFFWIKKKLKKRDVLVRELNEKCVG